MVTNQLDTAVKSFQPINQTVERYTRLCRAYVQLSERFHQLDVEHMTLKGQVVPLLKALKMQQDRLRQIQADKEALQQALDQQSAQHRQEVQAIAQTYEERIDRLTRHIEELRSLDGLLSPEAAQELSEAESQMELVEATIQEMAEDDEPDLTEDEKTLLAAYRANPGAFLVVP
ncbi:hypothetical protein GFS31_16280 [Leptolyngbya sp. BL0902]|uniref:hypothetical protein n=1 Tax=Leptolyngbya sp. BL0902 TaxID=1115757 RepID=UPI0018E8673B|nr:hypothetical protein [Leptolyngbya sp. BL0902]QQE64944.1 hypothetical protein GFS31_16280 [Leptolyngbya sp. BL0902]